MESLPDGCKCFEALDTSREVAFRSTEKGQHGNPQIVVRVAPTRCTVARDSPRTWTRPRHNLQAMGDFQGPEVDVLKDALASRLITSIEGTACTERRVHPVRRSELHLWSGNAPKNRRCWTLLWETGGGSSRTSARRGPHAGVELGNVVLQGEGGPVGSGTHPASRPRVCLVGVKAVGDMESVSLLTGLISRGASDSVQGRNSAFGLVTSSEAPL